MSTCTLQIGYDVHNFATIGAAMAWLEDDCDELDRLGGLYMTAASNGEESNVNAWMAYGCVDGIDYPDEIWSVVPRRSVDRRAGLAGRWWCIKRERA